MTRPRLGQIVRSFIATGAIVLVVSACGGASGPTIDVTANNTDRSDSFRFAPDALTVQQGGVIRLTNKGSVEHNLTIDNQAIVIYTGVGQTASSTINLPPGSYTFQCTIRESTGTHGQAGMKGALTVTAKP